MNAIMLALVSSDNPHQGQPKILERHIFEKGTTPTQGEEDLNYMLWVLDEYGFYLEEKGD